MGDRRRRTRSRSPYDNHAGGGGNNIQQRLKQLSGTKDAENNTHNNKTGQNGNRTKENAKIDREKTCPLLLRVFCQVGRHHRPEEFSSSKTPPNELQIYTWKDATLRELMSLVKEVNPEARHKGTYFDFAIIFPNMAVGGYTLKDIGTTCSGQKCPDDNVTLASKRFQIGDFLDIAIMLPPKERKDVI